MNHTARRLTTAQSLCQVLELSMFSADATVFSIVSQRPAFTSIRFLVNIFPRTPVCFT